MKILNFGRVIITEGNGIQVEDWNVVREKTDPPDATTEELLLDYAITWAREKFDAAANHEVIKAMHLKKALLEMAEKERKN